MHADLYFFGYAFSRGNVVTGSVSGDMQGDRIVNLTGASVFWNGFPFPENGHLQIHSDIFINSLPGPGANAYLSFDGQQNNFLFNDGLAIPGGWTHGLASVTGIAATQATIPSFILDSIGSGASDFDVPPVYAHWQVSLTPVRPIPVESPSAQIGTGWTSLFIIALLGVCFYQRLRPRSCPVFH